MSRLLPSPRPSPVRFDVLRLEERATPTVTSAGGITATLTDGTLFVQGTEDADTITVEQQDNGDFTVDGVEGNFNDVRRVEVRGDSGDDVIQLIADHVNRKQRFSDLLEGGDGNDTIVGSKQSDTISGGTGDDILDGAAGNDQLDGGDGDDGMLGGDGSDNLNGAEGNDDIWGDSGSDFLRGGPGDDLFHGGDGRDSFKDDFDLNRPATNGYSPQDVQQGTGGTCAILSVLAATAATSGGSALADRITYEGNDSYAVKLYESWMFGLFHTSDTEHVYFDGTWYDHDAQPAKARDAGGSPTGPPTGDFWALLYQRAVLQQEGVDWRDPKAVEDYSQSIAISHSELLGDRSWHTIDKDDAALPSDLRDALRAGAILTAGTPDFGKNSAGEPIDVKDGVVGGHAYAIIDVYQIDGQWRVKLYNPWGWDEILDAPDGRDDGMIDITWDVFVSHFDDYGRTDL